MRRLYALARGVAPLIPRPKKAGKGAPKKGFDPRQLLGVLGASDPEKIRASGVVEVVPPKAG